MRLVRLVRLVRGQEVRGALSPQEFVDVRP
ncbi:hypothetical protein FHU36_007698 [Nonomuraea muscovyensis]|uniref:Uncharacterized protein n=1 Tax=Nonomuraea muscovyensis TaxID=1124761 RepID=A0A7X0F301_9ACTN|nr:hypothetical protein [Nonomuraea muscovyensis]